VAQPDDEHERTRKIGVVRGVGVDVQQRERTASDLIRDPSRLFVAPVVVSIALESTQSRQAGAERSASIDPRRLPSGGQRVASEERGIQRHARLKREPFVGMTGE